MKRMRCRLQSKEVAFLKIQCLFLIRTDSHIQSISKTDSNQGQVMPVHHSSKLVEPEKLQILCGFILADLELNCYAGAVFCLFICFKYISLEYRAILWHTLFVSVTKINRACTIMRIVCQNLNLYSSDSQNKKKNIVKIVKIVSSQQHKNSHTRWCPQL